jgi:hypothetical protein
MTVYPMRNGILKIQIAENKESVRAKCSDAALWLWRNGLMGCSGLAAYTPKGIINARKVLGD